jgi:hypothetical protein
MTIIASLSDLQPILSGLQQQINNLQTILNSMGAGTSQQNGVLLGTDCQLSVGSVNATTGAVEFSLTPAATAVYVVNTQGVLVPVSFGGVTNAILTPPSLPAVGNYRGYGIEMDAAGNLYLVTGTDQANTGAGFTNINGPTTPTTAGRVRLWDIVNVNSGGSILFDGSRDRRPWANGYRYTQQTFGETATFTYNGSQQPVNTAHYQQRVEYGGYGELRVVFQGQLKANEGEGTFGLVGMWVDDSEIMVVPVNPIQGGWDANVGPVLFDWDIGPYISGGSRLLTPFWCPLTPGLEFYWDSSSTVMFSVSEHIRQNANNGTS